MSAAAPAPTRRSFATREIATEELAAEATGARSRWVVGIVDHETVGQGSMLVLPASGTAVRIGA